MVGLKQHALSVALFIFTIFMMIKCECDKNYYGLLSQPTLVCRYVKISHSVYFKSRNANEPITDTLKCRNVYFSEELLIKYGLRANDFVPSIEISDSIISPLYQFKSACRIKLINITYASNTHFLNVTNLLSLSIRSSNLLTFDFNPIPTLKFLDLSDNALTSLNTTNFRDFKLDVLNVSSNRLTNIYCENVALEIDLSNNGLDKINCKFAASLSHVFLNNNNLRNISKDAFKDMEQLLLINLSYNRLDEVAHIFSDLVKLIHLNLSNNNIYRLHFGCFENLKSLEILDLSYNEIVSLSHGIFNGLNGLEILDLSYNDIFELDVGIFYPSHFLHELYLEGNFLQDLDINILGEFSYLNKLSFTFNNISCNKLKNYVDIFKSKDVEIKGGDYFYFDNVNGIKCTATNTTDFNLKKFSFEFSLNSLKKIHVTLTIITTCFLVIMMLFVVIQYYRYKM